MAKLLRIYYGRVMHLYRDLGPVSYTHLDVYKRQIAKKYNMSYQTLYTWVKKFKEMGEVGLEDYRGKPIRLQTPLSLIHI